MPHPIEHAVGTVVARCTKARHNVEVSVTSLSDGGIQIAVRCDCASSLGVIDKADVLRLIERKPIEYDHYTITIE